MKIHTNKYQEKLKKEKVTTNHSLLRGSSAIQRYIQNPVKHQSWNFFQTQLTTESR